MSGTLAGCADGTVLAEGKLVVEGEPATAGRVSISPIGGGKRASSGIAPDGSFSLRIPESTGVMPGDYRVSLRVPLDGKLGAKLQKHLQGRVALDDLSLTYDSPDGHVVSIPEGGTTDLTIDAARGEGWKMYINE